MTTESSPLPPAPGPHGGEAPPADPTSLNIRRGRDGDGDSVTWIVERFSPFLLASARYRLRDELRAICDPEDLVQEVWMVTLPRLKDLEAREGHYTPVLLKFLSSSLLWKLNNLVRKHLENKPRRLPAAAEDAEPMAELASPWTGVITRVIRQEVGDAVAAALARLTPRDLELMVLRGIEQHAYKDIAAITGESAESLAVRYGRVLRKLRQEMPRSIFEELSE